MGKRKGPPDLTKPPAAERQFSQNLENLLKSQDFPDSGSGFFERHVGVATKGKTRMARIPALVFLLNGMLVF